ncbi:MAG TPA: cupin domain-containing protein [Vicinamibacterales bacterium]|nr:cupin domain-containing protein [Vicinamibacterales bacterium]
MLKYRLQGFVAGLIVTGGAWLGAQAKPSTVVAIPRADIDAVLSYSGSEGAGTDRQIRVVDLGPYRLGIGVLRRGATRAGAPVGAISHSQVAEVFYFVSGSGTLVTGGEVQNEKPYPWQTEFVRLAVGPSSGGVFKTGNRRRVTPGDVVVVPAGVPHGFDEISDQLTYLSIRPDLTGVLPAGYVHPVLRK